ncbi:MAG: GAF domain-containing protein [Oscillatoriales cyanobacterium C42_A2020_001]|nr:GAF domain-containing protein [Leptolyngbyaceae cyanobacterium C42_A2020_001]
MVNAPFLFHLFSPESWLILLSGVTLGAIATRLLIQVSWLNFHRQEDVAKLQQSQQELEQSKRDIQALLDSIPDHLVRLRRDGIYLSFIKGGNIKLIGEGMLAADVSIWDILPPAMARHRMEYVERALQTGELQLYEYEIAIDGETRHEEARIAVSGVDEVLTVVRDITDRKRAEYALQQQAERDRVLHKVTQAIRNSLDLNTIFSTTVHEFAHLLQANQAVIYQYLSNKQVWSCIESYQPSWLLDQSLGAYFPDQNTDVSSQLKHQKIVRINHVNQLKDETNHNLGCAFPAAWLIIPIYLKELWGCLGLVRQEQPWQDSEAELASAIVDQLAIAIQQSELYQQVQQLNTHLEQQVQERTAVIQKALTFEALLKRITDKVRDSLDENQILQTAVNELGTGLEVVCCNAAIYSTDLNAHTITHEYSTQHSFGLGQNILFADCSTPEIFQQLILGYEFQFCFPTDLYAPNEVGFHAVLACPLLDDQGVLGDLWLFRQKHDHFSDLKVRIVQQVANQCAIALRQSRLYQASQAQVQELERLSQLKDDFLSTVSHELRTPMSNIKMATQMLGIGIEQLGLSHERDRITRYLQILRDECQRETDLINDLLDLSRLDSGSDPLILQCMHLQYWLPHVVDVFAERVHTHQQHLVVAIADELPPLTTDFAYLEQVLVELLHNACKYTPAQETIKVVAQCINHQPTDKGLAPHSTELRKIQISVANSGVEIPASELKHVFDKFYRVPNNDPWKHGGTGLGLALVKKRIERLQGSITVTSENNWTNFIIQLPQEVECLELITALTNHPVR